MGWKKQKGKMIHVPIKPEDVMRTMDALPRTPPDAGLITMDWRYKKEWKTAYKAEQVIPEKIFYLLDHLKMAGNPYYEFVKKVDMPDYIERLERINISEEVETTIEEEVQASNEEKEAEE